MYKKCELILKELESEGKIKVWWDFKFPEKEPLKLRLKDMLEEQVDEKYYITKTNNIVFNENRANWDNSGKGYNSQQDRAYYQDGLCPALSSSNASGDKAQVVLANKKELIVHNIQQTVKVRKYPVNIECLKNVLRDAKLNADLNNKQIAEILNIPQTQVEHYFRTDSSFAIPSPEIWLKLKEMLGIKTDEFDESIMTFEEKDGVYEKANRIYDEQGLAPTLTQQEEKILVKNATQKGYDEAIDGDSINLSYPESTTRRGRVGHGVAQTLQCNDSMGVVEKEYERTPLTIGDNQIKIEDYPTIIQKCGDRGTNNYSKSNISYTIPSNAMSDRGQLLIQPNLRIRKLTPKECYRLMGFDDEDFEKAKTALNEKFYKGKDKSSSQLYKQAGNSIVVNVLEKIFKNLLEKK